VTRHWLTGLVVAAGCLVVSWLLLIVLARRLPPGILRDLAAFIPDCVVAVRRLRRDPRVPRRAKIAIIVAGLYVASPIDLIPEFIPVIGPLDDIVVVALALRYAGRQVPREVIMAAWPGETRLIQRLLGPARPGRVEASEADQEEPAGDDQTGLHEQDEDAVADPCDDPPAGPGAEQRRRGQGGAVDQDHPGE